MGGAEAGGTHWEKGGAMMPAPLFDPARWSAAMREARDNPGALADRSEVERDVAIFEVLLSIEGHLALIREKLEGRL